jgi:hypothetical protein
MQICKRITSSTYFLRRLVQARIEMRERSG